MIDPDTVLQGTNARPTRAGPSLARRLAPVAILVAAIGAAFGFGLDDFLTVDTLRENRAFLIDFVHNQGILAVAIYLAVYALAIALSLPGFRSSPLWSRWQGPRSARRTPPIPPGTSRASEVRAE